MTSPTETADREVSVEFDIADSGFDETELADLQAQLFGDAPAAAQAGKEPTVPAALAAVPVEEGVVEVDDAPIDETEDAGLPDSPQPCQYGPEAAVRSLLFRDDEGQAYVPVCDEHEQQARDDLDKAGDEILGMVDIDPTGEPDPGAIDEVAVTAAAASRPPADWFADPQLDGPTALRVTEDGRVYGHLAAWDVPHIGMPGQRITAPRSASGYAYFRTGAVIVDDGTEVAVGHITLDTGHAGTDLGRHAAAAHYDHTGTVVADVAAGEDEHGIWVAGALRSHVDERTAAKLRASALSGDWRRVGSSLELVAALGVNTPGFPIPRSRVASGMRLSLVAAGALPPRLDDLAIDSKKISDMAVNGLAFGQISAGKLGARLVISAGGVTFYNADGTELRVAAPADLAGIESREDLVAAVEQRLEEKRAAGELTAQHIALLDELDDTPALVASLLDELDDTPARFAALLEELDEDASEEDLQAVADLAAEEGLTEEAFLSRMPAQLRESYLRGKVAARIAWGTPGDFDRCTAQARAHGVPERMRPGMCNILHQQATGNAPGEH